MLLACMKRITPLSVFILVICLLTLACSEEDKVWVTQESVTTFPDGNKLCYCYEIDYFDDSEATYGYERASDLVEYYFWEGRKCEELGYLKQGSSFIGPQDGTRPGENGYFGSGSATANCDDPYQSPTDDVQLDAMCQTAYIYRCAGNEAEADFTCEQYAILAATTGNAPPCPYCD